MGGDRDKLRSKPRGLHGDGVEDVWKDKRERGVLRVISDYLYGYGGDDRHRTKQRLERM